MGIISAHIFSRDSHITSLGRSLSVFDHIGVQKNRKPYSPDIPWVAEAKDRMGGVLVGLYTMNAESRLRSKQGGV